MVGSLKGVESKTRYGEVVGAVNVEGQDIVQLGGVRLCLGNQMIKVEETPGQTSRASCIVRLGNGSRAGKHPEKEQTERQNLRLARMQEVGKGPGSSTAQGQGKEEERGSCDPGLSVQRESIGCQGCRSGDSMPLRADRWELIGS